MKKLIALLSVLALTLLASCGKTEIVEENMENNEPLQMEVIENNSNVENISEDNTSTGETIIEDDASVSETMTGEVVVEVM
ncbi:MAG: hypothetical protein PHI37_05915 [Candidatus Gracilibacteria bacterium]|nr:hypothetical protein [Candidatus Gracilibacteria bacterium]